MAYENMNLYMKAIADAIRVKVPRVQGKKIKAEDFPNYIRNIEANPILETLTVTTNGTFEPDVFDFIDGYDKVIVNVPSGSKPLKSYRKADSNVKNDFTTLLSDVGEYSLIMDSAFQNESTSNTQLYVNFMKSGAKIISGERMFSSCSFSLSNYQTITPNFDLSNCVNMKGLFAGMYLNNTTVRIILSNLVLPSYRGIDMEAFCQSLKCKYLDVENLVNENVQSLASFFSSTEIDLVEGIETWNTKNVTNFSNFFSSTTFENEVYQQIYDMLDFTSAKNISGLFYYCTNLEEIDMSTKKFPALSTLSNMFYNCTKLKTLVIPDLTASSTTSIDLFSSVLTSVKDVTFGENCTFGNVTSSNVTFSMVKVWRDASFNQYFDAFADSIKANTSGKTRTIKFYTTFYNSLTDEQKAKLTSKGYTVTSATS